MTRGTQGPEKLAERYNWGPSNMIGPVERGYWVRAAALTAALDENERLRGETKGLANWADAALEQIEATSCAPDDPEAWDEVMLALQMWIARSRAALKGGGK